MSYNVQSFDIILNIPKSNLLISSLDMEFKVIKTAKSNADYAEIVIWNLDEDSYKQLIQDNQPVYIYTKLGDKEAKLIFTGYSDTNHITRKRITVTKTNNEAAPPDIVTSVELIESRISYDNCFINENYREEVSAEQIINDCISAMGIGSVIINTEIPEKMYSTFKAKGKPHCILYEICDSLGLDITIQNGIVNIGIPGADENEESIPEFNLLNSLEPEFQNNNEALLITELQTDIYPNKLVKCNFEKLSGIFPVIEVILEGNNFDRAGSTNIIIGLEK